jgi:ubiquinone/menaquinone biosynthesis C-methylase UbiE
MHEIDQMLKLQLEGKHKEARVLSDKLENIGPNKILDPNGKNTQDIWMRHCFNRGWFLIQDGDYQKGCQLLENGRFLNVYGSPPLRTDAPIFNPEQHSIKDKSIIISLEGGYGDEIIHARFATSFKKQGARAVYIAAAPELISVFERIEGVDKVILRNQANTVSHDYWVPGFSAGWISGHSFDNFPNQPYLSANNDSIEIWKSMINSDKIKVGIRWAGNPKFEHQQFRRFPENFITNLAKYPELQVYSLQKDHNLVQLPEGVTDLQHFLISWEDTMAAISNLDIVITSCTSIAHIAAGMGKETWVLVPILPYHTWTFGSPENRGSPYYNCVRLFRQTEKSKWNDTFQSLYKELEEKFNLKHVEHPDEDRIPKRLNLGCGLKKIEGFINVDISPTVKPDQIVDLNKFPWPFADNEFDHIVAKDILEHLGDTSSDFIKAIKEMYRISHNGAIWEVQAPHWRCDIAIDDPDHKRLITMGMFNLFNKRMILEKLRDGGSDSALAFDHDVDIEIADMQFDYTKPWEERLRKREITQEELTYALNHFNNVALSVKYLIQVHKPGRNDFSEYEKLIEEKSKEPLKLTSNDL